MTIDPFFTCCVWFPPPPPPLLACALAWQDPFENLVKRRKRTVIFTAKNEEVASMAGNIFEARDGMLNPVKLAEGLSKVGGYSTDLE